MPGKPADSEAPTTPPGGNEAEPRSSGSSGGASSSTTGSRLDHAVSWLLLAGLVVSVGLMVAGVVLAAQGASDPIARDSFLGGLIQALAAHDPWGFFILGLLVLLATPVVWVTATLVLFARQRAWWFSATSLVVLVIIALSVVLGLRG